MKQAVVTIKYDEEKLNALGIANMRQVIAQIFHDKRRLPKCQ